MSEENRAPETAHDSKTFLAKMLDSKLGGSWGQDVSMQKFVGTYKGKTYQATYAFLEQNGIRFKKHYDSSDASLENEQQVVTLEILSDPSKLYAVLSHYRTPVAGQAR